MNSNKVVLEKAEKQTNSNIYLPKFESVYAKSVSKDKREKTMKELKDIRERLWKKSLEKANGDTNLAFSFYEEACDFS